MEEEDTAAAAAPTGAAVQPQAQQQQQQQVLMMETSLVQQDGETSMMLVDESNGDASSDVQDLQVTLQEKIEMRKNLESTFDCQTLVSIANISNSNNTQRSMMPAGSGDAGLSIQEKIFHFEQKVAANRAAAAASATTTTSSSALPPAGRPPLGPVTDGVNGGEVPRGGGGGVSYKNVPSRRLKVFLRLRPVQEGPSTIEVLPPFTTTTAAHNNQQQQRMPAPNHTHQQQQALLLLYPTKIRTHPPKTSNAAKVDRSLLATTVGAATAAAAAGIANNAAVDAQVKEYEFTRVFAPDASQHDVYTHTALPMVNQLCSGNTVGKSALLFCYGITNAGKTHTILGDPHASSKSDMQQHSRTDSWGIVPRCLDGVLQKVHHTDLQVYLSFLEVYNEHIFDLLPHSSSSAAAANDRHNTTTSLKIRERRGQIVVQGLAHHHVTSLEQGLALIRRAKVGRHTATNNLNQKSSRSHCVCRLTVKLPTSQGGVGDDQDDDDACSVGSHRSYGTTQSNCTKNSSSCGGDDTTCINNKEAHFWIVDLAGSERSKRTNMGRIRQQEAACINKSLMTLMRCLTSTKQNNKPYRDSKLTVLFMRHWNTLGSQTSMIVNAHASVQDYDETQHVLGYAVSVKVVPTIAAASSAAAALQALPPPLPRVEYGYDGHRKKVGKQRSTIRKVAKILRKLSPVPKRNNNNNINNNKRKNEVVSSINNAPFLQLLSMRPPDAVQLPLLVAPQPFARSLLEADHQLQQPSAKKTRRDNNYLKAAPQQQQQQSSQSNSVSSSQYNREVTSLQMALSEARAKIQVLTSKVTGLEQQVEATETQVRAEVAEEMLNEMTAMRQRYEETISRLKESKKKSHAPRASLVERNQAMVDELQERVEELEEDMERMAHHHEEELLSMQHEHAETLLLKDQEIRALTSRLAEMEQHEQQLSLAAAAEADKAASTATSGNEDGEDVESLHQQLADSRAQVGRLQRSKKELIATYEKLLAGGDDIDDEDDDNGQDDDDSADSQKDDDDDEEEEVDGDPTPKVERTKHRATLVQKARTNHSPTHDDKDVDASDDDHEDDEQEDEQMNDPTPKVERRTKHIVKKHQEEEECDAANDMVEQDACPTPSLSRRGRKPLGPVSDNIKQAGRSAVKKTVNASSSPATDDSIDIDELSQTATIQEPLSTELVM